MENCYLNHCFTQTLNSAVGSLVRVPAATWSAGMIVDEPLEVSALTFELIGDGVLTQLAVHQNDVHAFVECSREVLCRLNKKNQLESVAALEEWVRLDTEPRSVVKQRTDTIDASRDKKKELEDAQIQLAGHEARIDALNASVDSLRCEIDRQNATIAQGEQRQRNAWLDLIPFHALVLAISTGDAKRAIPFYSQVDGIISAVTNERDAATEKLWRAQRDIEEVNTQIETITATIAEARESIHTVEATIRGLDDAVSRLDPAVADAGRRLTEAKDRSIKLTELTSRYSSIQESVEEIDSTAPDSFSIHDSIAAFRELLVR